MAEDRATAFTNVRAVGGWLLNSRHGVAAIVQTILTKFFLAAVNLGTGIITARALGASGRGEQSAMLLWPALLAYLLTLGIPSAVRYCIRREPARREEFYTIAIVTAIAMSGIAIAVGWFFIPIWLHAYSQDVVYGAQLLMAFAPEIMLGLVLIAMFETIGDFKLANAARYGPVIATLIALVAMSATHTMTPFLSAVAYLAPPVYAAIWMIWVLRHNFVLRLFDPRPGLRVLGSYGVKSYGIDILVTLSAQIDQVLVIGFLNATEMGVYVVALNASRVLQNLHAAVVTVVFPTAAGQDRDRVVAMVGRAARISTAIAFVFAAGLVVVLPAVLPFFYGAAFTSAIRVAQFLTLEALLGGLASILAQAFMALGRPGLITLLQGVSLAVALPSMVLLMPRYGLLGAAAGLVISAVVRLAFLLVAYPVVLKQPMPNLVPTADDIASLRRAFASRLA